jgi:hypothetical protein
MKIDDLPDLAKASGDVMSFGIVAGTFAELLPHIAALLTIVWTIIRILETETVRGLIQRRRDRR